MTAIDLRAAVASDQQAVVALQFAAFAENRVVLGAEPLPLLGAYDAIFADARAWQVWLAEVAGALAGVLILQPRLDDLYIWSIGTAPAHRGRGIGRFLLAQAERQAVALERPLLRLSTGQKLAGNVAWYGRAGFTVEREEKMSDRVLVHMAKRMSAL